MTLDDHSSHQHADSPDFVHRVDALESLLAEEGLLSKGTVDDLVAVRKRNAGPDKGAHVVVKAWLDEDFRRRLFDDATATIRAMGYRWESGQLVAVANSVRVHNLIVCTLCSCYPTDLLGLAPDWYKDPAYRSQAVADPRRILREFGLDLDESVEIRVWDSTAEVRYMVVPERPQGSEPLSEDALIHTVSRDSMIGVTRIPPVSPR